MTAQEYLDAPDATTTASTFAGPDDLADYAQNHNLKTGDNGVGHVDLGGLDTTRADVPMVALPESVLIDRFGSIANARGQYVDVQHQGNGQSVRALIADVGPGSKALRRGVGMDLNPGAAAALGASGSDPVSYTFAGNRPNFGSAQAFLDSPDASASDDLDGQGGGATQGNAGAVSVPGQPDTFLTSNDGGALDRAQASVAADASPDAKAAMAMMQGGGASTPAAAPASTPPAATTPSLGSAAAFLAAPDDPPAAGVSNVPGNPFAIPASAAGNGSDPNATATKFVPAAANTSTNPLAVPPQPLSLDDFSPSARATLDKLVAPNPALTEPDTSITHQAANAGREVLGGAATGSLEVAEGFDRAMAGQDAATPASANAYLDNQIAQRQKALDQLNALPVQTADTDRTKDNVQRELLRLQLQRQDARLIGPGDVPGYGTPGLLTPEGQTARDLRAAAANDDADAEKAAQGDVPTMFGQDPALKDTVLARIGRSAGGVVPLAGASMIPGVGTLAAAGVAGAQAKANAYDEYFSQAKAQAKFDEEPFDEKKAAQEAQQYSDAAALRTVPEMAAYLGTGKVAAGVVGKLLSSTTPTATRILATAAASTLANAAAGTGNQLAEQGIAGKPLDASYSIERGVQDTLFGGLHAVGEMGHANNSARAADAVRADTAKNAPVDFTPDADISPGDTIRTPEGAQHVVTSVADDGTVSAVEHSDSPSSTGKASQFSPDDIQGVLAGGGKVEPAPHAPVDFTPDTSPVYATGDTPEQRAQSFLSSSDDAPVTAARFGRGEDVPATLGRFPQAKPYDGSTVVYDPEAHDAGDFTAVPSDDQTGSSSTAGASASVPVMITRQMEADLRARGFSDDQINRLTPQQANDILRPQGGPASTANAFTDAQRAARGLAPAEAAARRDFGQVWDDAKSTLADDPTAGQRLVDALKANPRPVSDTENALLLNQQIAAQAEHDAAVQAMNNAPDDAARASAQVRLARASDALTDVYDATNAAGAATGRGLNARKMLANQDYSLGNMLAKRQAAEGGKPLTVAQQAEVRAANEKVADTRAKADAHAAMVDDVDRAMHGAPPAKGDPDWSVGGENDEAQHRADLQRQAREGIDRAGGVELLDAVREAGGLPTDDPVYRGELQTIREAHAPVAQAGRTGTFNLFRGNAPKLDALTSRLRARGFDVETPDDALNLIYGRLTDKKPVYGFPARAEAQSGMAGSEAFFRRQPTTPPRTPEELRPLQEKWTRMLKAVSPKTALRLEVVKQSALDAMWNGQTRPTAADGSSPHAAYLDGAVYLSAEALRANSDQLNRVNLIHEIGHHFERALPVADRMRLETQWKQEMASGDSPLHDTDGTPRLDVDRRAFDTSDPKNFSEWLAERLAWDNEAHLSGKMDTALNGTPSARLAARIRDFVGRVWKTLKPGMSQDDINARFREWLGNGARVDDAVGGGSQAAVRNGRAQPVEHGDDYQEVHGDNASVGGPAQFAIRAFHGTPHEVDRFSSDKIGTGEGAQVYGHGLYFAEHPDVANMYAAKLSAPNERSGKAWKDLAQSLRADDLLGFDTVREAVEGVTSTPNWRKAWEMSPETQKAFENYFSARGNRYEVHLDAEPHELLDWDKSLSEQPPAVRDALTGEMKRIGGSASTGERAYKELVFQAKKDGAANPYMAASDRLRELGIPGLRYLDQGSRGAGDGSRNFVVFDDSRIRITHKNGEPVSMADAATDRPQFAVRRDAGDTGTDDPADRAADQAKRDDDFTLESATPEQLRAEADRRERQQTLADRQARPLTGTAGDTTADMFGGGDTPLFNERRDGGTDAQASAKRPLDLQEGMRQQRARTIRDALQREQDARNARLADVQQSLSRQQALAARMDALRRGDDTSAPQFAARRPLTDDERLDRAKKSLAKRRDELLRRVATGDLTPKSRTRVNLDAEGLRLQAEHARAKQAFDEAVEKARQANLPGSARFMGHVSGLARASALSGYHTLGKLFSFSMGAAAERPFKELAGAVIDHTPGLRRISAKADMEGGSHVASLARFYSQAAGRGMAEAWRVLRTGKSTDTALYGKAKPETSRWYDFFGRLHDVEKTPLFTGAMEAYRTKAYENAIRQGIDPHDPVVRGLINQKSYEYALADKLQEPNGFAEMISRKHKELEAANPALGRPELEKVLISHLLKTIVTKGIIKTPANFLKQFLFERGPIGLARGLSKATAAHMQGVEKLTDVQANHIHRLLSAGAVGTAMTLYGMYDATKDEKDRIFGGYYQPGDKRGDDDVGFGHVRFGGRTLPHWASHNFLTEEAQFGSTIVRVARTMIKKTGQQKGYTEGVFQAALAPAMNAPIINPVTRIERESKQGGAQAVASQWVKGLIPQLVQNIAEDTDKHTPDSEPVPREQKTIGDTLKAGIPGMRESLPAKYYRGISDQKRQQIEAALRN